MRGKVAESKGALLDGPAADPALELRTRSLRQD
ncbi:MAG: hypothetical protein JWN21_2549 [Sphingomonas bacterium]|nr:hypothetical protein [Sphingomonas bacterium]